MGDADNLSLYDRLNDSQKNGLNAIKSRTLPYAQESLDAKTGDLVIGILESWLMDDEQKQNLASNAWDIFFLYAAASLLSHTNGYKANSAATGALPENDSETSLIHESTNTFWPSFDIEDRQQSEILSLIGKGLFDGPAFYRGLNRSPFPRAGHNSGPAELP